MTYSRIFSITALVFCMFAVSIHATAQVTQIDDSIPWEEVSPIKEVGDVGTWRRKVPNAAIKQFRGEVVLKQPALDVLLTIDNSDELVKWVYFCRASKAIDPSYTYMEYKGVWPVASRYVTIESESWIDDGVIYISSRNTTHTGPEHKNMVKLREFHNLFEITPLSKNMTKVRFTTFVDLAGRVPSWLANTISSRAPKVTLSGLRDLMDEDKSGLSTATVDDLSAIASPDYKKELRALLENLDLPSNESLENANLAND